MNRGTIVLIAALLVVIVAVLVINNKQASAPGVTPTAVEATGPLIPGVTADSIVHYEVRDNTSGFYTALTKDTGGGWHIDGTNTLPGRDPDQSLITSTAGQIVTINYNNTFQNDQLADFGLNAPAYTIVVNTSDGKEFTLYVGAKAPTSSRYYTVLQTGTGPAATEAAAASTAEAAAATTEATAETTAEATAAAKKVFRMIQATAEATSESASTPEALAAATAEAIPQATAEATADVVQNPAVALSGNLTIYVVPQTVIDTLTKWITIPPYAPLPTVVPTEIPAPLSLPLPTLELLAPATAEANAAATQSATSEATAEATAAS